MSTHPYSPRHVHAHHNWSPTRRWQRSTSPTFSDSEEDLIESSSPTVIRQDSKPSVGRRRLVNRPSRTHLEQDDRSMTSQNSSKSTQLSGGWGGVVRLIKNDMSEQGYVSLSSEDEIFEPVYRLEKLLQEKKQGTRLSRHSSIREDHRAPSREDGWGRRESFRGRHVHFLDERRRCSHSVGFRTNLNGQRVQSSPDHTHLEPPQGLQGLRRNVSVRRSYHFNVRRTSVREGTRTSSVDDSNMAGTRLSRNAPSPQPRVQPIVEMEDRWRDTGRWEIARGRNSRQRAQSLVEDERRIDRDARRRVRRSQSECWQIFEEERLSPEEELERRMQRVQSCNGRSSGAGAALRRGRAALDLGELEQVLLDEELARRLQEEEERLAEETPQGSSPLRRDCPVGDFRAAQVAQDEEIARFMQKQEIKAKRRSQEVEPTGGPEWEHRGTDRRASWERQRRRLDSEGLQSPVDDLTPDHQLSSHNATTTPSQAIRNIAEELDPTFQRKDATDPGHINGAFSSSPAGVRGPSEEPSFVPPTKRQSEGRVKPKDKKDNTKAKETCKQQ